MLKQHKNKLYDTIQESKLDTSLFEFVGDEVKLFPLLPNRETNLGGKNHHLTGIHLRNSPMWFVMGNEGLLYDYLYVPFGAELFTPEGSSVQVGEFTKWQAKAMYSAYLLEFQYVAKDFGLWLEKDIKEYLLDLNTPDLWEQAVAIDFDLPPESFVAGLDLEPFTESEKETIRLQIKEFKRLLAKNYVTTTEERKIIDERLDYLTKAVDRLNRIDWKSVALSTLIGIATALTLDTEKGRLLFVLFEQAMHTAIHLLGG